MNKIKEKLTGHSSSDDRNKLEKSHDPNSNSSATSKIQNPISSSSGPTGTAVSDSTHSSHPQHTTGHTSTTGASHGYPSETSGYNSTSGGTTDRMPGSYVNDESHIPTSNTTTSSSGPRQPFDPYSSKGQETAARAGHSPHTSRTTEDPSLMRSKDGGIMNQHTDQRYDPHTSSTSTNTSSSHNYGRDAALAGGAGAFGAGGLGAHEYNKDQPSSQPLTAGSHQQPGQYQDASHMQQSQPSHHSPTSQQSSSMPGGAMGATLASSGQSVPGESPGLTQARKLGGAYEAGYRDAMEHMREEMRLKGSGFGQAI